MCARQDFRQEKCIAVNKTKLLTLRRLSSSGADRQKCIIHNMALDNEEKREMDEDSYFGAMTRKSSES